MTFEIWNSWLRLVSQRLELWEYILLLVYALVALILLIRSRRDFTPLTRRRLLLLGGLLAASVLLNNVLFLDASASDLLPPPNVPLPSPRLRVPLLGSLPIFIAAVTLGAGPALVVGLIGGLARANALINGIAGPLHMALFGYIVGYLLQQDYRGRIAFLARQPLVAAAIVTPFAKLLLMMTIFAHVAKAQLNGLDYAITVVGALLGPSMLESLIGGGILQVIYWVFPVIRPVRVTRRTAPYGRSLHLRLMSLFLFIILVATCVLVYTITRTTIHMEKDEALDEMRRDAHTTAEEIPYFLHTGMGLLTEFAKDERLWQRDVYDCSELLKSYIHTIVFFDQLMLLDADGQLIASYPTQPFGDPTLTSEETRLLSRILEQGATQISPAHASAEGEPVLSFLVPVEPPESSQARGMALIGRTKLDSNPVINRILTHLQWAKGRGEGFIVNSAGTVIAHSDPNLLLNKWYLSEKCQATETTETRGCTYESQDPVRNTRQLIYYLPAEGHPWAVVISVPYEVVMERTQELAAPLLTIQILFSGSSVIIIPIITSTTTRPLKRLADAADRIADGDLEQPIHSTGEDEIGRVGKSFEGMRLRLKDRINDLSLLLKTSQAVSATLDLSTGIPFILQGTLKATGAQVARIVLLSEKEEPQMVISRGTPNSGMEALDRSLATAVREQMEPVIIENLTHARSLTDPTHSKPIKAAVALPAYSKRSLVAVIWIGYGDVRCFDEEEINLLSTLASQTAVLVENARLFQSAEKEHQRLSAILDSTSDVILVTDQQDRILLANPAFERAFGLEIATSVGQKIDALTLPAELRQALTEPDSQEETSAIEISNADERTLYTNISAVLNDDGDPIGHVAVMRDITQIKELDEMKTEFLATVSHDLRTPLMFMRGYAKMLPTVGDLTDKQMEYVENILQGVGQINDLVGDLLDLGRIEAGVGFKSAPCHLTGVVIEAADSMRAKAAQKDVTLKTESIGPRMPTVSGDATLLRRAVTNLVDNAIKYTPSGGEVTVDLSVEADEKEERALIRVTDTGIGIGPQDQMRLFERFYRIQRAETAEIAGTGLGLAIVKSIIDRHGGRIWVESELNQGSTFYVSLPLRDEAPNGAASARMRIG